MKYILKIVIVYCFVTPVFSQNSISFALGTEYHSAPANYQDVAGFAIGYMRHFESFGELGLTYNYNAMSLILSSPSKHKSVNVSVSDFYLVYGYRFAEQIFSIDLKPVLAAGFKVIDRQELQIDLGAFGEETIPAFSKTYFSSFVGLLLSRRVSNNLSFFIEPGYSVYNISDLHNIFSIKGGIDVSIN